MTTRIPWVQPPMTWVKLNVDGAVNFALQEAGVDGAIRNNSGIWLGGFSYFIGHCEAIRNNSRIMGNFQRMDLLGKRVA